MADEKHKSATDESLRKAPGRPMFANQDPGPQILTKVTLKQDHRHADVAYKAGDTIEVNEADANWLRDNKVI